MIYNFVYSQDRMEYFYIIESIYWIMMLFCLYFH